MESGESMRKLAITVPITVRTHDIDSAGHVSNIVYLRWLEDMRLDLFEKYFSLKTFLAHRCTMVLAETKIQYKRPIRLFQKPVATMWIESLRASSLEFRAEIYLDEVLATAASHIGVFVDLEDMRPIRIPKIVVEKFKDCQCEI